MRLATPCLFPALLAASLMLQDQRGEKPGAAGGKGVSETPVETSFRVVPVGRVEKNGGQARIRIFAKYADALKGLGEWSHVNVLYWFDKNDVPFKRRILQVHPRHNPENPLTGVFACRAPVRPNLVALSVCRILKIEGNVISIDSIDAFDSTPVIDLKPFVPRDAPTKDVRVPEWAAAGR